MAGGHLCEKCGNEHDGSYATGRFCSAKCSRSFSRLRPNLEKISSSKLDISKLWGHINKNTVRRHISEAKLKKLNDGQEITIKVNRFVVILSNTRVNLQLLRKIKRLKKRLAKLMKQVKE